MTNGGIFNGPTALGYLGLGATSRAQPCAGVPFSKELQAELKRRGYNVRQDGIWDGCCQSAIIKEIGSPLTTTTQVQQFLGRPCSTGYLDPIGVLLPGPWNTVLPSCTDGSDKKESIPGTIPTCQAGQFYDMTVRKCAPIVDPYGCLQKCKNVAGKPAEWARCLLECNAAGANLSVPVPPGPKPEPELMDKDDKSAADVFGSSLPIILGALAIGVTAAVYFATRKKQVQPTALANRKRRRRRKKNSKGRR